MGVNHKRVVILPKIPLFGPKFLSCLPRGRRAKNKGE